ncbi:MAG TPA: hypothetical protein VHR38_01790 [Solirubrobacterales bacterium]|nr:hypothetical protein [Solirubrobacterales bacterium]
MSEQRAAIHRDHRVITHRLDTATGLGARPGGEEPEDQRGDDPAVEDVVLGAIERQPDAEDEVPSPPTPQRISPISLAVRFTGLPITNALYITIAVARKNAERTWKKSSA